MGQPVATEVAAKYGDCWRTKGVATVSIGIYLRVLYALQLEADILLLAKDDPLGRDIQDLNLKQRQRASKKQ